MRRPSRLHPQPQPNPPSSPCRLRHPHHSRHSALNPSLTSSPCRCAPRLKRKPPSWSSRSLPRLRARFRSRQAPHLLSPLPRCRPASCRRHCLICQLSRRPWWPLHSRQTPSRLPSPPLSLPRNCRPCPRPGVAGSSSCLTRLLPAPRLTRHKPPTVAPSNPPRSRSMAPMPALPSALPPAPFPPPRPRTRNAR